MSALTDPEILAFVAASEAAYPADANLAGAAENRCCYDAMCAAFRQPRPSGVSVSDTTIDGAPPVPVRWYRSGSSPATILFCHGGGFVVGSLDSHDDVCAEICVATRCELVAVDYRLAPEHPYPKALDDMETVYRSLLAGGRKVIGAGDSAGGNLIAALCRRARRLGLAQPAAQVLIYPGLSARHDALSFTEHAEAPMLRTADCSHYHRLYAGGRSAVGDPELAPLEAEEFGGLAPVFAM